MMSSSSGFARSEEEFLRWKQTAGKTKELCLLKFHESDSVTVAQRHFHTLTGMSEHI